MKKAWIGDLDDIMTPEEQEQLLARANSDEFRNKAYEEWSLEWQKSLPSNESTVFWWFMYRWLAVMDGLTDEAADRKIVRDHLWR